MTMTKRSSSLFDLIMMTAVALIALLVGLASADTDYYEFIDACTAGHLEEVKADLARNPSWANRNDLGETCLHAAAMQGHVDITKAVLQAGGDPNIWISHDAKYKISALSYHVFSGHVETSKVLLEYGADPNALITSLTDPSKIQTPLDTVYATLESDKNNKETPGCMQGFYELKDMLIRKGGKTYSELIAEKKRALPDKPKALHDEF